MYNLPSCINFKLYHLLSLCIIDEIDKVFFNGVNESDLTGDVDGKTFQSFNLK